MAAADTSPSRFGAKPKPSFPLRLQAATGQWRKYVAGAFSKYRYYGTDKGKALKQYKTEVRDGVIEDLKRGRKPRDEMEGGLTVKQLCNQFLAWKRRQVEEGDRSENQWDHLKKSCGTLIDEFGSGRLIEDLRPDDFQSLRDRIKVKKSGALISPRQLRNKISNIKSVFNFAEKCELIDKPIRYGVYFDKPSEKAIDEHHERTIGDKDLSVDQIHSMLGSASLPLRTMILLGVNCGLDVAGINRLRQDCLDLDSGWYCGIRSKTAQRRRSKLWNETTDSLSEYLKVRPKPNLDYDEQLVFITREGNPWGVRFVETKRTYEDVPHASPISTEINKLFRKIGIYVPHKTVFGSLRHTTETVGGNACDQVALNFVMGHKDKSMGAVYRGQIRNDRLEEISEVIHAWLFNPK